MRLVMARLEESDKYLNDSEKLDEILKVRGYLFFRDLLGRVRVEKISREIITILKRDGFVDENASSEPMWSGRLPKRNELTLGGDTVRSINRLSSLRRLILRGEHVNLLRNVLGGKIFSWVDNVERGIRIYLPGRLSYGTVGGIKGSNVTPAHQDFYFFRNPNFYTCWIPLMDIDESVGGLAIVEGSHQDGYYQHWFKGSESLGVPENSAEAGEWFASGARPATGDLRPNGKPRTWLNTHYRSGDLLVFHPLVLHRGLENRSDKIRLSADLRYQRADVQAVWRARHRTTYSKAFETEIRNCVSNLGLEEGLALRVIDKLYVEGPSNRRGQDLEKRARAAAHELGAES